MFKRAATLAYAQASLLASVRNVFCLLLHGLLVSVASNKTKQNKTKQNTMRLCGVPSAHFACATHVHRYQPAYTVTCVPVHRLHKSATMNDVSAHRLDWACVFTHDTWNQQAYDCDSAVVSLQHTALSVQDQGLIKDRLQCQID